MSASLITRLFLSDCEPAANAALAINFIWSCVVQGNVFAGLLSPLHHFSKGVIFTPPTIWLAYRETYQSDLELSELSRFPHKPVIEQALMPNK